MSQWRLEKSATGTVVLSLVLLVASAVVFALTASAHLDCDEPQMANIVQYAASWHEMFVDIFNDANAPAMYVLLRIWTGVVGTSDLAFKAFSTGLAVMIPPMVFAYFDRPLGRRLALTLAVLVLLCASFVHHAQLVRPYGMVMLLGLAATMTLDWLLKSPERLLPRVAYAGFLASLPYCHMSGLLIWCGHLVAAGWNVLRKEISIETGRIWCGCVIAAVLLFLPGLTMFIKARPLLNVDHLLPPVLLVALPRLALDCGGLSSSPIVVLALSVLFWLSFVVVLVRRKWWQDPGMVRLLHLWLPLLVGMIGAECVLAMSVVREQYLVHFIVPCLLVILLASEVVGQRLPAAVRSAIPFLLLVPIWAPELIDMHRDQYGGISVAANYINKQARAGAHAFVLISRQWYGTGFARYLDHDVPFVCLPEMHSFYVIDYSHSPARLGPFRDTDKVYALLEQQLNKRQTVFHVFPAPAAPGAPLPKDLGSVDPATQQAIQQWLVEHAKLVDRQQFPSCGGPLVVAQFEPRQ